MKYQRPKRCEYCAHKLDKNGKCQNPDCIAYTGEEDKKESDSK